MSATNPSAGAMAAAKAIEQNYVWGRMERQRVMERAKIIDKHTNLIADQLAEALEQVLEFSRGTPLSVSVSARSVLGKYKSIKP